MKADIIKPTKLMVDQYLRGTCTLCYQHINWWLQQKGSKEFIQSVHDKTDLRTFCKENERKIIVELANMLDVETPEDRYGWLFGE